MHWFLIIAAAAAVAEPAGAEPIGVEASTGLDYKQGEYGTGQRIETSSIPVRLRVEAGRLQLGVTLPYLRVDAPGNVVGGGGVLGLPIIIDPTRPATRDRREGIGDLRLGAAYSVAAPAVSVTLATEVKVPTASQARGLGTGELDYSLGAEVSKTLGRVTPFAGVGYTVAGDPDGYELRNSLLAHAGAALRLSDALSGRVSYGYARSLAPLVPDEQQIATSLNARLSERLVVGVYGAAGLSESSPDIGAGIQLGFRIR